MTKRVKVAMPAIKTPSGRILTAGSAAHHKNIASPEGGKKGFLLTDGTFANRTRAGTIATVAKQVKKIAGKPYLHSHDLEPKE